MSIKQTVTLLRQDLTNALRDNLVLYMFVAPVLLALGARFLLPSLEETKLSFAVQQSAGAELIAELEQLGDVEQFESREDVLERVQRSDDVPGIMLEDGGYVVYLEGNEPEGQQLATIVMSGVLNEGEVATFVHEELRASRSLLGEYGAVVLVMLAVMMGALIMGFLLVDEKETHVINALAVSPLTMGQYTFARGLFAVSASTMIALISSAILVGTGVNYALLFVAAVISSAVGLVIGYVVGGFTENQLQAIGLIKIVVFAYLTIPVLTIFVPDNWQWAFYLLPNYWMFKILENLYVGQMGPVGFWGACGLTLLTTGVYLAVLVPLLRPRMRLRYV